jgi:hypothetical protein
VKTSNTQNGSEDQASRVDFLGEESDNLTVDRTQGIKTISVGYCNMLPERAKIANRRMLIGRIGGMIRGTERQLRNPEAVQNAKSAEDKERIADYGIALVGDFNADVIGDDGEVTAEFADVGFAYLPGGFHEATLSKFAAVCDATPDGQNPVLGPFSTFIWAEPATNPRGYRYVLTNAQRVNKQLNDLRRAMQREAILVAHATQQQLMLPAR